MEGGLEGGVPFKIRVIEIATIERRRVVRIAAQKGVARQ